MLNHLKRNIMQLLIERNKRIEEGNGGSYVYVYQKKSLSLCEILRKPVKRTIIYLDLKSDS